MYLKRTSSKHKKRGRRGRG